MLSLGLIAQGLFASRFIIQLIASEKAGKVLSPKLFWQLSLFASFLLILYGFFRSDPVIVGGQLIGYLIYVRNLQLQGEWSKLPNSIKYGVVLMPIFLVLFLVFGVEYNWNLLLVNPEIKGLLLTWGTIGQVIFTSRFLVQWIYSEKIKTSSFPLSFWYISIAGALMIAIYAIYRKDAVLFIGQGFGLIVYIRNIYLHTNKTSKELNFGLSYKQFRFPALITFTVLVLFFNLGAWNVTESSEARYAQIAKEMVESGDYLHPTLMGIYHYHKPPLTYWITAAAYHIFGVSAWSARFFLQISIIMQIVLVYKIWSLLFLDKEKAFYAATLYASFPIVIISGRALTTDCYLAFFILAAMYYWFSFIINHQRKNLLLFHVMLGLGFLTKGPVVLIVPLIVVVAQRAIQKIKFNEGWTHLLGIGLFLVIGLSWFVILALEDREFINYFLFKHTIQRFATNTFGRSQPFWFYIPIVLGMAFPWVFLILVKTKRYLLTRNNKIVSLISAIFIPLIFFSLSQSKLILYILPIFPGIAVVSAFIWFDLSAKQRISWDKILFAFQILVLIALSVSPFFDPGILLNLKFYFIVILTLSLLISIRIIPWNTTDRSIMSAYLFTMGLTVASSYFFSNNSEIINDQKKLITFIEENLSDKDNILIYDRRLPSLQFLTNKNIVSLYDGAEELNRETQFEKTTYWKNNPINLKTNHNWLVEQIPTSSILLIKKGRLKRGTVNFPPDYFKNEKEMDGWIIFY